jgi:ABC-2 type transport system permease protein
MYVLLLKTFLKERLSLSRLFGRRVTQSKVKSWLMVALLVYAFGVSAFSIGFTTYSSASLFQDVSQYRLLISDMYSRLIGLGFLFGFFQAQGYLFQYKDYDLLGSLPIPQFKITLAKISLMMMFLHIFSLVIVLPEYVIWWWFVSPPWYHIWIMIPLFLLAPLPFLLIGSLVSFFIRKVTQRFINAQTIQTIFSVLAMVIYLSLILLVNQETFSIPWLEWVNPISILSRWFLSALNDYLLLPFIGFLIIQLILFMGYIWVMNQPITRLNQQRQSQVIRHDRRLPTQMTSIWSHLLRKETKRFLNTPVYLMNTGFGLIILILMAGLVWFIPDQLATFQLMVSSNLGFLYWSLFAVFGFAISTVFTPAVSLSLEGHNLPLLKSLPLEGYKVFFSKVGFNLILIIPITFIVAIILGLALNLPGSLIALFIAHIIVFSTLLSLFFMLINIWFPRFDFQSEVEVVKQSLASLFAVFGGFAFLGGSLWLALGLLADYSLITQILITISLQMILVLGMGWHLLIRADYYWNKLTY